MIRARSLTSLCLAGLLAVGASCSSQDKPRGQLMIAIASDMAIPKDLDQVVVEVLDDSGNLQRLTYPIKPAELGKPMPGTLAVLPTNAGGQHVRVRLIAELDTEPPTARVVREAEVTIPTDRIAVLPMPLHWLCDGKTKATDDGSFQSDCPDKQTCVAGDCKPDVFDVRTLADFDETKVFGGGDADGKGGHCIDVPACFASAAVLTPDASCSVPTPPGVSTNAINVALVTASGDGECSADDSRCFVPLDHDPVEGWDFNQNSITLPSIVCDRIAEHKLSGVAVSTACTTKDSSVPICGPWTTVDMPSPAPTPVGGGGSSGGISFGGASSQAGDSSSGADSNSNGGSGNTSTGGAGIGEAGEAGTATSKGGSGSTSVAGSGSLAGRNGLGGTPGLGGSTNTAGSASAGRSGGGAAAAGAGGTSSAGAAGTASATCPGTQPVANSACTGALQCVYASSDCACVGAAWNCTAPCTGQCLNASGTIAQPKIDDFEDGNGDIYGTSAAFCVSGSQGQRSGFWYTFNDGSNDTQIPAPNAITGVLPQSGACHGGSWCMDTVATTGYTSYAGLGLDLNDIRGSSKSCAYNAGAYTGVSFWIRGAGVVRLQVPTTATMLASASAVGTCVQGTSGAGSQCDDYYGYDLTLTGDWQEFTLPFTQLAQADWSGTQVVAPFDATQLLGLQFVVNSGLPFAFSIDDLSFY
jgi:hypothetical protein